MKIKHLLILSLFTLKSYGQIGGNTTYKFLNLPNSSRIAALGGGLVGVKDDDINLVFQNPSLLNPSMSNQVALSYINYFSDINFGYALYTKDFEKIGTFSTGIQYINYGNFTRADPTGQIAGEFKAGEYAYSVGYGKQLDSAFSLGSNLKIIYSSLEQYKSIGTGMDFAGTYHNSKHLYSLVALIKNVGMQWKPYVIGNREPLPFEIQLGFSKKLPKAPFRYYITLQHLEKWDLTYNDPKNPSVLVDPLTGDEIKQNKAKIAGDKLMRHVIIGGEMIITKNFNLRLGYNYERRQELKVETRPGLTGFSFGVGLKVSKFNISYARAIYHLAGASNHFTLSTKLSDFYTKSQTNN